MHQQTSQGLVKDGELEALWGGAGGLQGYRHLTRPLEQEEKQQQEGDSAAVIEDSDLQQQVLQLGPSLVGGFVSFQLQRFPFLPVCRLLGV